MNMKMKKIRIKRQFESVLDSIYCGCKGEYVLNRTARNRMKQARRAILRCGFKFHYWGDRRPFGYNEQGELLQLCLYYDTATGKPMVYRISENVLWAPKEYHITIQQLKHAVKTRPVTKTLQEEK